MTSYWNIGLIPFPPLPVLGMFRADIIVLPNSLCVCKRTYLRAITHTARKGPQG